MRVEVAFAVPLSAAIWTTYSPGAENRAVVTSAFGSANVTVPGPDTRLQATAGAGPGGGGGGGAACWGGPPRRRCLRGRSEEHTSELQSQSNLVCRLLLEKKKKMNR